MNLAEGYVSIASIAQTIDFSFIKTPRRALNAQSKQSMAVKVFIRLYELMLEDVVENNVQFQPPVKRLFRFYVGPEMEARTKRLNKKEKHIFEKKFKQYAVYAVCNKNKVMRQRFVTLPRYLLEVLDENGRKNKYLQKKMYT